MIRLETMDNLDLMRSLPDNHIDLIYCDILYGTGRNFGDYQDLRPIRSEIEAHYIPRIKEMHRILKDTGSIYLQMDTRINHWMRFIMDDIFGYENFKNEIIWEYFSIYNGNMNFAKLSDRILFYKKSANIFNIQYLPYSKDSIARFKRNPNKKINYRNENYDTNNIIERGKKMSDIWTDIPMIKGGKIYDTQKPKALIERIIKASSNEGDLVGDFYMGSGTTAEVCQDLNRNFIGCDINPRAIEITKERLKKAENLFTLV